MNFIFLIMLGTALAFAKSPESELKPITGNHIKEVFEEYGATGTCVIYQANTPRYIWHQPARADSAAIPASTFKIFNSLVALEEGAVKDTQELLIWDGTKRFLDVWNKDHNMRSAIRYSAVWFYQDLARRIGPERMQYWIDKSSYGNKNISGAIDRFWLDGGLRISASQQVAFLRRLYNEELPFSEQTIKEVKKILIMEKTATYTLSAKTGWAVGFKPQIGWYVGYIEFLDDLYFFAMNMDINKASDVQNRTTIIRTIFGLE